MTSFSRLHVSNILKNALLCIGLCAQPVIAEETLRAPVVTVATVTQAEMIDQVPISGTLVPRDEVQIYPQVSGYTIDELSVDIGDYVTQGAVLARLNSRTLEVQLAQAQAELTRAQAGVGQAQSQINAAEASLRQAQSVYERAQQLRTSGAGSQASLDQAIANQETAAANVASLVDGRTVAQAQQQQAQAQVDIAQLNLGHATILAPVDGLIADRNGRLGAIATSGGDPIYQLIAQGLIEVEAEVVETAISGLEVGNTVHLDIAGIGPVSGQVRLISPVVDPVTRLGLVRITTQTNPNLRSGLFASGWIVRSQRTSLTVPASAVLSDSEGTYVMRVQDNTIHRQPVTAGLIWQNKREIITGLDLDQNVVAKAGAFFADGDQVNPVADANAETDQ